MSTTATVTAPVSEREQLTLRATAVSEEKKPEERTLLPPFIDVLSDMRYDNRPFLIRKWLGLPYLSTGDRAMERHAARLDRLGDKYSIPDPPFSRIPNARGTNGIGRIPERTPFLAPQHRTGILWRSIGRSLAGMSWIVR